MTRTKIGFVLLSNTRKPIPSTRITVLNMIPYLCGAGFEPHIVFEPKDSEEEPDVSGLAERLSRQGIEIAYFQKVHGRSVLAEIRKLSALGIRTLYGVCDLVEEEMTEATDATIVVTDYLKGLYESRFHHKIHVVHDGIENPEVQKNTYDSDRGTARRPMRAVLVTSSELDVIPIIGRPPAFLEVKIIGHYPHAAHFIQRMKRTYWKLAAKRTLKERCSLAGNLAFRQFKVVNWDNSTVYGQMAEADIGIIPVDMSQDLLPERDDVSFWQVKSENRLTMKMAVGLPVIASPVPSYKGIVAQGRNGYLASGRDDWIHCLEELRNPERRRAIGECARSSVIQKYSKDAQAAKLIAVLESVRYPSLPDAIPQADSCTEAHSNDGR